MKQPYYSKRHLAKEISGIKQCWRCIAWRQLYNMTDLFGTIEPHVKMMPEEYKGKINTGCGFTKSAPREWTEMELEWVQKLKSEGYGVDYIATSIDRTPVSVSVKLKRLGKKDGHSYNAEHSQDKYNTNLEFFSQIQPKSVLDLFSGCNSWYKNNTNANVLTNDENPDIIADYHEKAEMLIHKLYYDGYKFDLVDLDPFGSAYDCFDLAIKMAKKAVVITYGEMGHLRFKRLDYVRRYYGIDSIDDFTIDRLITETQKIASRSKKILKPVFVKNWNRISRVYFTIETMKITDQWEH